MAVTAPGNLTGRGEAGSVGRVNGEGENSANGERLGAKIQSEPPPKIQSVGEKSSVVQAKKVQSPTSGKRLNFDDDEEDEWRFEIKRKRRTAGRKNSGSTAKEEWYYWVVRIHPMRGTEYYGTLDILDRTNPERLQRYWRNSGKRK